MYKGEFAMGQFSAVEYTLPVAVSKEYPFILTAGRKLYQHCSTTMTNKTDGLNCLKRFSIIAPWANN
jgi:predicted molibdopterin-dependent oxidoreductase YjgC